MKVILVESCDMCPYIYRVQSSVGELLCGKLAQNNSFEEIEDSSIIPSFCPLEDAKEAADAERL